MPRRYRNHANRALRAVLCVLGTYGKDQSLAPSTKTHEAPTEHPAKRALRLVAEREEISDSEVTRVVVNVLASGEVTFTVDPSPGGVGRGGYISAQG